MVERRNWTQEEEVYLEENIGEKTLAEIADDLGRTRKSVGMKAARMGLKAGNRGKLTQKGLKRSGREVWTKDRILRELEGLAEELGHSPTQREVIDRNINLYKAIRRHFGGLNNARRECGLEKHFDPWSDEEVEILKEKYPELGSEIPELLENRNRRAIRVKAGKLGLKYKGKAWTDEELDILREKYPEEGPNIPQLLERHSRGAIVARAHVEGLESSRWWTDEELEILRRKYPRLGTEIPELLERGRSRESIKSKAWELGVATDKTPFECKSEEEKAEIYDKISTIDKPTELEERVIGIVDSFDLPFKYVGDGAIWIDGRNPDFMDTDGSKRLIEVFGDYWHIEGDEEERRSHFAEYGFDTLILWEHEINRMSDSEIAERIKEVRSNKE